MNIVVLSGYVGQDAELSTGKSGTSFCRFSLATQRWSKDKETDWHRITCFGKTAEFSSPKLKKGVLATVSGEINYGEYVNKEGITVKTVDIIAREVSVDGRGQAGSRSVNNNNSNDVDDFASTDIPF